VEETQLVVLRVMVRLIQEEVEVLLVVLLLQQQEETAVQAL
jgi:hypothetical protein